MILTVKTGKDNFFRVYSYLIALVSSKWLLFVLAAYILSVFSNVLADG